MDRRSAGARVECGQCAGGECGGGVRACAARAGRRLLPGVLALVRRVRARESRRHAAAVPVRGARLPAGGDAAAQGDGVRAQTLRVPRAHRPQAARGAHTTRSIFCEPHTCTRTSTCIAF